MRPQKVGTTVNTMCMAVRSTTQPCWPRHTWVCSCLATVHVAFLHQIRRGDETSTYGMLPPRLWHAEGRCSTLHEAGSWTSAATALLPDREAATIPHKPILRAWGRTSTDTSGNQPATDQGALGWGSGRHQLELSELEKERETASSEASQVEKSRQGSGDASGALDASLRSMPWHEILQDSLVKFASHTLLKPDRRFIMRLIPWAMSDQTGDLFVIDTSGSQSTEELIRDASMKTSVPRSVIVIYCDYTIEPQVFSGRDTLETRGAVQHSILPQLGRTEV